MTQPVYVSPAGRTRLIERVARLTADLALLREEKNVAYTASGDTWHDNPFFNKLEQDERSKSAELAEAQSTLARAHDFVPVSRPTDAVRIGSIVEIGRSDGRGGAVSVEVWEIGCYGDSDIAQRRLAYNSPLGALLVGQTEGDCVSFAGPRGPEEVDVRALHAEWPTNRPPSPPTASRGAVHTASAVIAPPLSDSASS